MRTSRRCRGLSLMKDRRRRRLSISSAEGTPSFLRTSGIELRFLITHLRPRTMRAFARQARAAPQGGCPSGPDRLPRITPTPRLGTAGQDRPKSIRLKLCQETTFRASQTAARKPSRRRPPTPAACRSKSSLFRQIPVLIEVVTTITINLQFRYFRRFQ